MTESIGHVRSASGRRYEVFWDPRGRAVYVKHGCGDRRVGVASSAGQAMRVAEAAVYDR